MKILGILTLSALSVLLLSRRTLASSDNTLFQGLPFSQTSLSQSTVSDLEPDRMTYPPTRQGSQVDTYFGVSVPAPYRWLEDDNSDETALHNSGMNQRSRGDWDIPEFEIVNQQSNGMFQHLQRL